MVKGCLNPYSSSNSNSNSLGNIYIIQLNLKKSVNNFGSLKNCCIFAQNLKLTKLN